MVFIQLYLIFINVNKFTLTDYSHSSHHDIKSKSSILFEMLSINNNKLNTDLGKTKEITSNFISFYERVSQSLSCFNFS